MSLFDRLRFLLNPHRTDNPRAPWLTAIELARLMAVVMIFMTGGMLFMVIWHQTNPIKEKEVIYVEFQTGGNNFVRVAKAGKEASRNHALISMEARRYVMAREPIDDRGEYQAERYATVRAMSCDKAWADFKNLYGAKDGILAQKEFRREVKIESDSRLADGAHLVQFKVRDWKEGITSREAAPWQSWAVTLAYSFEPQRVRYDEIGMNGTGFTVCEYNISRSTK